MRIRPADAADIPAMMDLAQRTVTAAHWSRQQYETLFCPDVPRRLALVVEDAGVVAGFLISRVAGPEWEIENVAVAAATRRRGLGSQLLRSLIDYARAEKVQAIHLEVRESNRAARSLYEKWGFAETARRKRYYLDPAEDAVIYRLCFE
ncbi:MAG TPA: ribosomal protein S18-alanine N-acetyltransferase [Terriglobales bacterium]|jgi:ribosomal-protein-alanine N-acetyltransferase